MPSLVVSPARADPEDRAGAEALRRNAVIALIAFLTLVDLFATQAILPRLTTAYGVSPAAMGLAVNACTLGMAVASLATAVLSRRIDRRRGIVAAMTLLAVPTLLLSVAPGLASFAALRVLQGLLMATAFTLTLAYLGERCSGRAAAAAFSAYIAGNVASNLFGRLLSAAVADHFGLAANFGVFAGLNLAGAALAWATVRSGRPPAGDTAGAGAAIRAHLTNPALAAAFGVGFAILFAFLGTFTFVNFVLVAAPIGLDAMGLGFVYLVFLPSIPTTLLAGRIAARYGIARALVGALAVAGAGLPLLLAGRLGFAIGGLALVAVGTFFAQAVATGFVGRAAAVDRGAASGLYLASYFLGGLAGTALLGAAFDGLGWPATVAGIGAALAAAALLAPRLRLPAGR
ncbi:MFS transporter [Prosthecomicrobium sp. N25]|uniref:MFS transporter n=1 Tax=Prosthecomicrobium sp. N25 TaxID=3129254 RepID=UPI003077E2D6